MKWAAQQGKPDPKPAEFWAKCNEQLLLKIGNKEWALPGADGWVNGWVPNQPRNQAETA